MYGVDTLVPHRKRCFTDDMVNDMFRTANGASLGRLVVDWESYHWRAVRACFATLAEEGSRKDEVAKATAATAFRKGRLTFASLVWKLGTAEVPDPSPAQLRMLQPGNGVWLKHGIAKNDPFGAYFSATPSFLAFRPGAARCACTELAALEIAAAIEPHNRATTPLFGPAPGAEFTHNQLDCALRLLLHSGAGVPLELISNYSVHSFRIFCACALLAAKAPNWLIKRMLRWRGDESLEIYARLNDKDWAEWGAKTLTVPVDSAIASRLPTLDFTADTQERFNQIANAMLSLNASTARAALAPL